MSGACICRFFWPNQPCSWRKSLRKEYRQMSDEERRRYHAAMWGIKNAEYRTLSGIHADANQSPGAHAGPSFLPWHREFIKRIEIAMRRVDSGMIGLPYWDSALDQRLPDPRDSVIWSQELMGRPNRNFYVDNGAFANWTINDGSRVFQRQLGLSYSLYSDSDLQTMANIRSITDFLAYTAPTNCSYSTPWYAPEFEHGKPHSWVGGDMFFTRTSTYDPIFFQHHSFVDLIWENWRISQQSRATRAAAYPPDFPDCTSSVHFSNTQMFPFSKLNIDGLSNDYMDNLVDYAPRPTCFGISSDCESRFLFCDNSHGAPRCVSKVVLGGNCQGFVRGEDVCYQGVCFNGRCSIAQPTPTSTPLQTCLNNNYCCEYWASIGHCQSSAGYMTINCQLSCGICQSTRQFSTCDDRVPDCFTRERQTDCSSPWMAENCRQFCGLCRYSRQEQCTAGFTGSPLRSTTRSISFFANTTTAPRISVAIVPSCYNHHMCCIGWAKVGYCSNEEFTDFMTTFCAPSCNKCGKKEPPKTWNSTTECVDFLSDCSFRSENNGCEKQKIYMKENCKKTCGACDLLDIDKRLKHCQLNRGDAFSRSKLTM